MDLPALDLSLLVTLPKLIGPDLQRLQEAIEHDDADWGWDALTAVHKQIDTPSTNAPGSPTHSSAFATSTRVEPRSSLRNSMILKSKKRAEPVDGSDIYHRYLSALAAEEHAALSSSGGHSARDPIVQSP